MYRYQMNNLDISIRPLPYSSLFSASQFALRERLFSANSSFEAVIGFLFTNFKIGLYSSGITGKPGGNHALDYIPNIVFTIRSSMNGK